ncbi:MAG: hypothetical protein LQ346_006587 [Caloplaca aetnensis]|nr:MAG: hypothetical protein LQ346_006587 [Caloplaca aetnensis]
MLTEISERNNVHDAPFVLGSFSFHRDGQSLPRPAVSAIAADEVLGSDRFETAILRPIVMCRMRAADGERDWIRGPVLQRLMVDGKMLRICIPFDPTIAILVQEIFEYGFDGTLIETDLREPADTILRSFHALCSLYASRCIRVLFSISASSYMLSTVVRVTNPGANLHDVESFLHRTTNDAKAIEYLQRSRLESIGVSGLDSRFSLVNNSI